MSQMDKASALQENYDRNADMISQIKKMDYEFNQHSPTKRLDNSGHEIYRVWFNFPPKRPTSIISQRNKTLFIKIKIFFFDEITFEEYTMEAFPWYTLKNVVNIAFSRKLTGKIQVRESLFCG